MPFCAIFYFVLHYFLDIASAEITRVMGDFFLICIFLISLYCFLYLIFDYLFGITTKSLRKGGKNIAGLSHYEEIYNEFLEIKLHFEIKNVSLFISRDDEINAFAVGCFRENFIIITQGMIDAIGERTSTKEHFTKAIAGIIAHEMSHITHRDFLPGLLLYYTKGANLFLAKILHLIISFAILLISMIPIIGFFAKIIIKFIYKCIDGMFNKIIFNKIVVPIDFLVRMLFSRHIEHRADGDSARCLGGIGIAIALNAISPMKRFSWQSILSSHPSTKSRIKFVSKINQTDKVIKSGIIEYISNIFCICVLLFSTVILYNISNASKLPHYICSFYELSYVKVFEIKDSIEQKIETGKKIYALYKKVEKIFG
ncbi:M48 family metallopeptidase [Candidatus Deianiraea vastatrix]|uniref:HtpX-like zinc-metalloprotease n=1 Tax=Candidatus Deianiraea vastatrix TaxID=2163644 RepID=A0A5B8XF29_9RICK|nr:M48 family metalloprotease [Candidatus Deianiraea vastatrix]QED23918.1 Putative HtpX-like zinc-metalloprotease [Candidatus Deianiraea vastatrix]